MLSSSELLLTADEPLAVDNCAGEPECFRVPRYRLTTETSRQMVLARMMKNHRESIERSGISRWFPRGRDLTGEDESNTIVDFKTFGICESLPLVTQEEGLNEICLSCRAFWHCVYLRIIPCSCQDVFRDRLGYAPVAQLVFEPKPCTMRVRLEEVVVAGWRDDEIRGGVVKL